MSSDFTTQVLGQLAGHPELRRFDYFQELPSTNDRALQLAGQESIETPALILAHRQTGGRGRGGNRWWAAPGALTFSLLLSTPPAETARQRQGLVSLAAGISVCDALRGRLPASCHVGLKWPNDVLIDGRKVCGILIEMPPQMQNIVIGVGINVNNSLSSAPPEIQSIATAMCDETGDRCSASDLLLSVIEQFLARWQALAEGHDPGDDWNQYCLLTGRTVRLQAGARIAEGRCEGIDREGALLLRNEQGLERHFTGVAVEFE